MSSSVGAVIFATLLTIINGSVYSLNSDPAYASGPSNINMGKKAKGSQPGVWVCGANVAGQA